MSETGFPIVLDGALQADRDLRVNMLGGVFQFGEGLFETFSVIDGLPLFLGPHVSRLQSSARALGLGEAPDEDTWRRDLACLLEAVTHREIAVRFYLFRDDHRVRRAVTATEFPQDAGETVRIDLAASEFQGPRPLAHHKTLSSLAPRLACEEGRRRGLDEVVLIDSRGTVLEGSHTNVFKIEDQTVITPSLELPILPGVTRQGILVVAQKAGFGVREEEFSWESLLGAEEVFLTSSLRGVRPVGQAGETRYRNAPGPVTRAMNEGFLALKDLK